MHWKKGFRRLVLVLNIVLSIFVAVLVYMCVENPEEIIKWSEVQNSEKFEALSQQQQAAVKQLYWDDVISRDYGFQALNHTEQEVTMCRFFGVDQLLAEQPQANASKPFQIGGEVETATLPAGFVLDKQPAQPALTPEEQAELDSLNQRRLTFLQNMSTEELLAYRQRLRLEKIKLSYAELHKLGAIAAPNYNFTVKKHSLVFIVLRCIISGGLFLGIIRIIYFIIEWIALGFL